MGAVIEILNSIRRITRRWGLLILGLILAAAVVAFGDLAGFPIVPRSHRFAELDTVNGRYFIAGAAAPFAGWYMSLYWKRPKEPWVVYDLEHDEPYWFNVKLIKNGARIENNEVRRSIR